MGQRAGKGGWVEVLRLYRCKERCLGIRVAQEVAKGLSDEDSGGFWIIVGGLYKSQEGVKHGDDKLLVSHLISPIVVPYIIPYITPFKEFRQ